MMNPNRVGRLYDCLLTAYGPQDWWPGGGDPLVVMVGAILTQRTSWRNAELALGGLQEANLLSIPALARAGREEIERAVRSSGFYRAKAATLQTLARHVLREHRGEVPHLLFQSTDTARRELLSLRGIGPETADAILLYAGGHPSFVVDAYARRILLRLGWIEGTEPDEALRAAFMEMLPADAPLYNEYHALLVQHAKVHCRPRPGCGDCPIADICSRVGVASSALPPEGGS